MSDIYQRLWDGDRNKFSVSSRQESGEWENENADILLDEQVQASGDRTIDLAENPLFYRVNEEKLAGPTYAKFIKLLDNYVVSTRGTEEMTSEESGEIDEFLDEIMGTPPMAIALDYIGNELKINISEIELREKLAQIWFKPYTNYYYGNQTEYASGFEHTFVGEGKYYKSFRDEVSQGKVSGYHSWIKFYLDEKKKRVNYWGYKYDRQGNAGAKNPRMVTLQMEWNYADKQSNQIAKLFKEESGFFVGTSPECEMAMGTVMYYESLSGNLREDSQHTTLDDANYKLVLLRNTEQDGGKGVYIRSFFPIFMGNVPRVLRSDSRIGKKNGPIAIYAALPDPRGRDEGKEWVELKNISSEGIDLTGWEMRDSYGGAEPLDGAIAPGEVKRFRVTRSSRDSMSLRNHGDAIELYDAAGNCIAWVEYGEANFGEIIQFYE